jgi:hypothetical protein
MVTRAELGAVCERVLLSKDADARVVALALQRYLVGEGRRGVFDKRSYQRSYMQRYRRGEVGGKKNVARKRGGRR